MTFQIESRNPEGPSDNWDPSAIDGGSGANEFPSRESAEDMIPQLKALGPDWWDKEYRVTEIETGRGEVDGSHVTPAQMQDWRDFEWSGFED